jgi:hypothetical protein
MAILDILKFQNLDYSSSLLDWRLFFLASIPLSLIWYFLRQRSDGIDITKYSHLPQPGLADPVRGHLGWLEKIAVEGDVRRAFGTGHTIPTAIKD